MGGMPKLPWRVIIGGLCILVGLILLLFDLMQ